MLNSFSNKCIYDCCEKGDEFLFSNWYLKDLLKFYVK